MVDMIPCSRLSVRLLLLVDAQRKTRWAAEGRSSVSSTVMEMSRGRNEGPCRQDICATAMQPERDDSLSLFLNILRKTRGLVCSSTQSVGPRVSFVGKCMSLCCSIVEVLCLMDGFLIDSELI